MTLSQTWSISTIPHRNEIKSWSGVEIEPEHDIFQFLDRSGFGNPFIFINFYIVHIFSVYLRNNSTRFYSHSFICIDMYTMDMCPIWKLLKIKWFPVSNHYRNGNISSLGSTSAQHQLFISFLCLVIDIFQIWTRVICTHIFQTT